MQSVFSVQDNLINDHMSAQKNNPNRKRLGILQAGRAPDEMLDRYPDYNQAFVDLLGESAFDYQHWAVLDNEFPDSIESADAWLITGSRHGAYEEHVWIPPLEDFIRAIYQQGAPMVGICFGHQIIAQALGGKVEKFSGGWSVGRVNYALDKDVFGQDGKHDPHTALLAFHQDQVIEKPADAITVGSTDFCEHAALLYQNNVLTLQPHPEFTSDFVEGLLDARGKILPAEIQQSARHSLHQPVVRDSIAATLRDFLIASA